MGCIPEQVLEDIAAEMQAAAADIGAKYGVGITFARISSQDPDWPAADGIVFEVNPLDEDELTDEARNGDLWNAMLGEDRDE